MNRYDSLTTSSSLKEAAWPESSYDAHSVHIDPKLSLTMAQKMLNEK